MKRMKKIATASLLLLSGAVASAAEPVAGKSTLGVTQIEMNAIISGWSVKKNLIGKSIVNDQKEKVGKIEDVIITPDNASSFAIIGAGGFLGLGRNDVAIPLSQIRAQGETFILPGATKEQLKAMPKFDYAKK